VGILGATGAVGQQLVNRLHDHPWFDLVGLSGSSRSQGKAYSEAVSWLSTSPIPETAAKLDVVSNEELDGCRIVFSALDRDLAAVAEPRLAHLGRVVVSNASAFRMDPHVPLVIPEVNPDHLELVKWQTYGDGFIVTNPNCATVGLVMTLKPLVDTFGVDEVGLTTLQAVSGAGYPGVASLDILGNVLPLIPGEEEKLESEPGKILGCIKNGVVERLETPVSAQATRVPVLDGHVLSVSVKLTRRAEPGEIRNAMDSFRGSDRVNALPSAPKCPLKVFDEGPYPQPKLLGDGMTVSVGPIR